MLIFLSMARHVAKSLSDVKTLVDMISTVPNPQFCEFEMRLGRVQKSSSKRDDRFITGVDAAFVSALLCRLETSTVWSEVTPWTQIIDRFYLLPSGLQVRTSSQTGFLSGAGSLKTEVEAAVAAAAKSDDEEEDDDDKDMVHMHAGMASSFQYETSHMIKTSLAHVDLKWVDVPESETSTMYSMRVGLKHEVPVFEDELQECVEDTNTVRIKQRRSFRYAPSNCDRVQWAVEITQVWQASTYLEALECLRRGEEPVYEVEVECLDVHRYIQSCNNDTRRVALSMLLKASALFGLNADSCASLVPA